MQVSKYLTEQERHEAWREQCKTERFNFVQSIGKAVEEGFAVEPEFALDMLEDDEIKDL